MLGKLVVQDGANFDHDINNGKIKVTVVDKDTIVIARSFPWNGKFLHCTQKVNRANASTVFVYPNYVKISHSDNSTDTIINIPISVYGNSLAEFAKNGLITVDVISESPSLDYPHIGLKFTAKQGNLYVTGFDQEKCIFSNNKKIVAILNDAVILEDGTISPHIYQLSQPDVITKEFQSKLYSDVDIARNNYLELVEEISDDEKTDDQQKVKQVMLNIGDYLNSEGKNLQLKHTYEALTNMLKDRTKAAEIAKQGLELKPTTNPNKNLAIGIVLLVAAAALIGVAAVSFAVLWPIAMGMLSAGLGVLSLLMGVAAIGGAIALPVCAGFKLNHARVDNNYNKDVKSALQFFGKTESASGVDRSKVGSINNDVVKL